MKRASIGWSRAAFSCSMPPGCARRRAVASVSTPSSPRCSDDRLRPMKRTNSLALLLVGMLIACLPVLLTAAPPLVDYPNHLARMHIIGALGASPTLGQFYELVWRPIPNLAMDVVVPS